MMSRISAITLNTFREAVRDRILYNLVFFALLLVGSAPLFSEISIGLEKQILVNLGLSAISFFGTVIAILVGIGLVSKEIDKKTLYTILSRPTRRWEVIFGKYLGLVMTLVVNTACMTAGFYVALGIVNRGLSRSDALPLVAIYFIILQFMVLTAITLLFSTFSSTIFSAIFAFSLFAIGTFSDDLRNFAEIAHGLTRWLATAAAYVVPNFASLNVILQVQPVSGSLVLYNTIYAALYSVAALAAAVLIFERRNLK